MPEQRVRQEPAEPRHVEARQESLREVQQQKVQHEQAVEHDTEDEYSKVRIELANANRERIKRKQDKTKKREQERIIQSQRGTSLFHYFNTNCRRIGYFTTKIRRKATTS
jgi:vacuolar-type H+-ATPase subunit I/STV1